MRYISTRGQAPARDFTGVLLAGLAEDGGLYVPENWPSLSPDRLRAWRGLPYPALVAEVMRLFVGAAIPFEKLQELCVQAYSGFAHPAIVPLQQLETDLWSLELFHGPSLAFKDLAMQLLGKLFEWTLNRHDQRVTIVGATSGDTGSAAIEACRGAERIDLIILHPHERTSAVQRRQMTTVQAANVTNLAIEGSFDDCQDLVKAMFADEPFRHEMKLSAVNSINWARVAAQIPYYIASAIALGAPDREVSFAVPTGNFGNVLAAWAARKMGVPIARLVVGSNRNDILTRFLHDNDMSISSVQPSLSPSMDIQVSSNFERLLFEILGRNTAATAHTMREFRRTGRMDVPQAAWQEATALFRGVCLSDEETLEEIGRLYRSSAYLADPHSAAGRAEIMAGVPMVAAATAHPAKFPDAMQKATGLYPALPPHLADLHTLPESFTVAPNDVGHVQALVRAAVHRNAPGNAPGNAPDTISRTL
jgi:threonine synthase